MPTSAVTAIFGVQPPHFPLHPLGYPLKTRMNAGLRELR